MATLNFFGIRIGFPRFGSKTTAKSSPVLPSPEELRGQLEDALAECNRQLLKADNLSEDDLTVVTSKLLEAASHLAAPNLMINSRGIIGKDDFRQHYQEGLGLVAEALELLPSNS